MMKRRELLAGMLALPLMAGTNGTVQVVEEPHALSIEAGKGYRALTGLTQRRGPLLILPGTRGFSRLTYERLLIDVLRGSCLVIESGVCFSDERIRERQSAILKKVFGVTIRPCVRASSYIDYSWPVQILVRSFHAVTPIVCDDQEVIARQQGIPVCAIKRLGKGCVVYLGSMLGPGLFADEREAHLIGNAMLSRFHQFERISWPATTSVGTPGGGAHNLIPS